MAYTWDEEVIVANRRTSHRVSIVQGEYVVLDDPDAVITTVLGSCVAACIRDPKLGIGGMNHFVLPGPKARVSQGADDSRYGFRLMKLLIDDLLSRGANLRRLEAKVFGGASPCNSYYNIGEQNSDFAIQFLAEKGISVVESRFGGMAGCKLEYWPVAGKALYIPLARSTPPKAPLINLKRVMPLQWSE
jgi:chemotaxis protein CheD